MFKHLGRRYFLQFQSFSQIRKILIQSMQYRLVVFYYSMILMENDSVNGKEGFDGHSEFPGVGNTFGAEVVKVLFLRVLELLHIDFFVSL